MAEEYQRFAWFALDVLERGEDLIVLRRGMTIRAILPKSHIGQGAGVTRRPIHRPHRTGPAVPAPEPAVVRHGAVANHDGGAVVLIGHQINRIHPGAGGGRRRIHLFDDDGPVRHRLLGGRRRGAVLGPIGFEPSVEVGRVPDHDRRMGAEIFPAPGAVAEGADPGSGVADALVGLPASLQVAMAHMRHEIVELRLVFVQRQAAGMAHDRLELLAQLEILRDLRAPLLIRTARGGLCRQAAKQRQADRQCASG